MANNRIQVKRTTVSGRTPNTTNAANTQYIAAGEFALNMADGILYSSNGSTTIEVGANNTISFIGNSTVNAVVNSTSIKISNSTSNALLTIPSSAAWSATNYFLHANGSWVAVTSGGPGSSNIAYQDTAPVAPALGQLYWNSALGKLVIRYADANTTQWVEAHTSGLVGPSGPQGSTGATGAKGDTGSLTIGTVDTLPFGSSATVNNSGSSTTAILNFGIPSGTQVNVGTTTTGAAGSSASVTNSGNTSNVVLAFTIPVGNTGANGATGPAGPIGPKGITIPNPVAGDTFTILWSNADLTVAEIKTLVRGTSPTVNATISWGADRSTASNTIITNYTTSNVTNGNTATSFTNATPTSNSYIWVTINSTTGTVTEYHATLRFA